MEKIYYDNVGFIEKEVYWEEININDIWVELYERLTPLFIQNLKAMS